MFGVKEYIERFQFFQTFSKLLQLNCQFTITFTTLSDITRGGAGATSTTGGTSPIPTAVPSFLTGTESDGIGGRLRAGTELLKILLFNLLFVAATPLLSGGAGMAAKEDRFDVEVVTLAANDILLIQGDKVVGLRSDPLAA